MKLIICEKHQDQARPMAEALGLRKSGMSYEGSFDGQPVRIVWAAGHLIALKPPDEVNPNISWNDPRTLRPVPKVFEYQVNPPRPGEKGPKAKDYLNNIAANLKKADEVWLATDADREGEAVGWRILNYLRWEGPVKRVWLTRGLDRDSVISALRSLREPHETKAWYYAADARSRSDYGCMFLTRALTFYARHGCLGDHLGYGKGPAGVTSVGRVQTPSLAMIVDREREIQNFRPVDHYRIAADFEVGGARLTGKYNPTVTQAIIDAQPEGVTWEPSREIPKDGDPEPLDRPLFTGKAQVEAFRERLLGAADKAVVQDYQKHISKKNPPKTFDLAAAQVAICSALKITPDLAQTILEDLYEQGWTSYARTSHAELPAGFYQPEERNPTLEAVARLPELADAAHRAQAIHDGKDSVYQPFRPPIFVVKEMNHYGIIPTKKVMAPESFAGLTPQKKSGTSVRHTREQMQASYLLIARQYIQALFPPAQIEVQTVDFRVPVTDLLGHPHADFRARGERTVDPGWTAAFGEGDSRDSSFGELQRGQGAIMRDVSLNSEKTKAPPRYTEIRFPVEMQRVGKYVRDPKYRSLLNSDRLGKSEGIGTPATRKNIILTLKARGYIKVNAGGQLAPTEKGFDLIDHVSDWLRIPETTAHWEEYLCDLCELTDMAEAKRRRDAFVAREIEMIERELAALEERYLQNLGPRRGSSSQQGVSDKAKQYIRKLAERKGIRIPDGVLTDPEKAKAFLDEHAPKRDPNDCSPSPEQIAFARELAKHLPEGFKIPADAFTNREACSAFIEQAKDYRPPTKGQANFARKLWEQIPEGKRPEIGDILATSKACSAFINEQTKDWKRKGGRSSADAPRKRTQRKRAPTTRARGVK